MGIPAGKSDCRLLGYTAKRDLLFVIESRRFPKITCAHIAQIFVIFERKRVFSAQSSEKPGKKCDFDDQARIWFDFFDP